MNITRILKSFTVQQNEFIESFEAKFQEFWCLLKKVVISFTIKLVKDS